MKDRCVIKKAVEERWGWATGGCAKGLDSLRALLSCHTRGRAQRSWGRNSCHILAAHIPIFALSHFRMCVRLEYAKPLYDCLFFAGEATNAEHPACVDGAYVSGVRAAREVKLATEKG